MEIAAASQLTAAIFPLKRLLPIYWEQRFYIKMASSSQLAKAIFTLKWLVPVNW